uniref:Uncharacterized protein n=1 Tax=uncultured prokaryote TaxID=198431 RepID=A0A0H5PYV9_9ZZZZ|nr:hypothetical protein [uncultured prokaryote]
MHLSGFLANHNLKTFEKKFLRLGYKTIYKDKRSKIMLKGNNELVRFHLSESFTYNGRNGCWCWDSKNVGVFFECFEKRNDVIC